MKISTLVRLLRDIEKECPGDCPTASIVTGTSGFTIRVETLFLGVRLGTMRQVSEVESDALPDAAAVIIKGDLLRSINAMRAKRDALRLFYIAETESQFKEFCHRVSVSGNSKFSHRVLRAARRIWTVEDAVSMRGVANPILFALNGFERSPFWAQLEGAIEREYPGMETIYETDCLGSAVTRIAGI